MPSGVDVDRGHELRWGFDARFVALARTGLARRPQA
ncbi:hypothetical protein Ga0074812_1557 [Parafrankia irregularis]|uniref:Uncharacterized protein n=1 Tax=Parafrankia irregularis TaxID=795642 RepID=A0A0S4R0Z0_9ACTN|nr:hypothetical protein Ga0074812_1557 [Parafrankia irregularis]